MLHGGGLEKAIPARTIETHSPPGIEKTLNNMLREKMVLKNMLSLQLALRFFIGARLLLTDHLNISGADDTISSPCDIDGDARRRPDG